MSDPNSPTAPKQIKGLELEIQATRLRLTGATLEQIGEALGVTAEGARKAIIRALKRGEKDSQELGDLYREMERQRLESLMLAVMPAATKGHLGAVDQARRLSESIRKLLNLDLAEKNKPPVVLNIEGIDQLLTRVYGSDDTKS